MSRTAMIIGGGVAGPVSGMALRQAGYDAQIYEAHAQGADDLGAFLTLQTNGIAALRAIDADGPIADLGFATPRMRFVSGTGKLLGTITTGGALADGTVSQTLRRSQLYAALRDQALARGVGIHYGRRLVQAQQSGGRVRAAFADHGTAEADVLIGCDGIRSTVRTLIDPDAPAARYVPLLNLGGYADGVTTTATPGEYTMVFGKRAFFGYVAAPDGQIWWFANPPSHVDPGSAVARVTDAQWRQRLGDLFADDASAATEIIAATPGPLRGWTIHDLPTVPRWHRGAMVVIGDAAHATSPSSGQGASMAIEDAVVLAKCLRDLPDPSQAFTTFEALRRDRVERVVAAGAKYSNTKVAGPVARVFRDLFMPLFLRRLAGQGDAMAWLHGYEIDWHAPVTSPVKGVADGLRSAHPS